MSGKPIIEVAGGVYVEQCLAPARRELYGSGGRAAAVICTLGGGAKLSTYLDDATRLAFEPIASVLGIDLVAMPRPHQIVFGYSHPLARPDTVPGWQSIAQQPSLQIQGERSLRFGIIEGDAIVKAGQVVYDPQNLETPQSFHANGSSADRLALVLNHTEAKLILRQKNAGDPGLLAARIAEQENAEVVIIKQGAAGALVWEREHVSHVTCFRTDRVWKIGSGDTFSGAFAYYWMLESRSAHDAARAASLASAHYCNGGDVSNLTDLGSLDEVVIAERKQGQSHMVYLAGPFFTTSELWLVTEAWRFLKNAQIPVFSPYHDVGRGTAQQVGPKDIAGIEKSSAMLALVDGCDPGTLFEVGYARARGIPVVALAENPKKEDLKMLEGSGCEIYSDFAAALYRVASIA